MAQISRRNFIEAAGIASAAAALAACDTTTPEETPAAEGGSEAAPEPEGETEPEAEPEPEEPTGPASIVHDASEYPIDPDASDVEALWTSEKTKDEWTRVTADGAPELGVWDDSKIIQVDGLAFKDLNGNGKLDFYEDWRQPIEERAADLASQLDYYQAMLLMWHGGDASNGARSGLTRSQADGDNYVSVLQNVNEIQRVCEDSELGIPYLQSTDPYLYFDMPAYCCYSACMDKDMWRKAGNWLSRLWRASGIRCLLGPQVDVYSQPLGVRLCGSVSEDPRLNRDFVQSFCAGMQSTWGDDEATEDLGWGKESCAAMLKHYVGEGSVEGGRNDHAFPGEYNVFPGGNFNAHLIPFLDGGMNLDSVTGENCAVMPCYGMAYSPDEEFGENVGSGYSKRNLGILRNAGWDGLICTDWGILTSEDYGVENLTQEERYAKMIEAGVDQYGGGFQPELIDGAFDILKDHLGEDEALARVRDSARRIFKVMLKVDLFENPYNDRADCKAILENEAGYAFGLEISEKSVVMLKNHDNVISADGLGDKPKVYIPQAYFEAGFFSSVPTHFELGIDEEVANELFDVVTDEVPEVDGTPTLNDVIRADADALKDCKYAIIRISNPADPSAGVSGANQFGTVERGQEFEYIPITLQYEPYTAEYAREYSYAGSVSADDPTPASGDAYATRENRSYKGKTAEATNYSDLELVKNTRAALPDDAKVIVIIEADRPMVFSEIEPYCDVIFFCIFETMTPSTVAYANLISGKTEPSALLQYQMPKDMRTVEESYEDVPRDLEPYEDEDGNVYDFAFGLNWSGQIKDERYENYSQEPLTEPETEVIPG